MYLRPGFVVFIVGCTLTGLSTVIVALRLVFRGLIRSYKIPDHLVDTTADSG